MAAPQKVSEGPEAYAPKRNGNSKQRDGALLASTAATPVDRAVAAVRSIEEEIKATAGEVKAQPPAPIVDPKATTADLQADVEDIGRMLALVNEAAAHKYETTADEIEATAKTIAAKLRDTARAVRENGTYAGAEVAGFCGLMTSAFEMSMRFQHALRPPAIAPEAPEDRIKEAEALDVEIRKELPRLLSWLRRGPA